MQTYTFAISSVKTTSILEYTNDALSQSTSYKGEVLGAPAQSDVKQSVTIFAGNEGEEKAQRTFNYNFAGDAVKTTSTHEHSDGDERKSSCYKDHELNDPQASDKKQSVTIFAGNEGEEKAQRTFNYNFAGDAVKTTSILEYTNDALTKSTSYKVEVLGVTQASDKKQSVTIFAGNEGEEKAQRTFNYNFAGDAVKTT